MYPNQDFNQLIEDSFTNHTPTPEQIEKIEKLREMTKDLAKYANEVCPDSRPKSLGFTNLETSLMYYVKSLVMPRRG